MKLCINVQEILTVKADWRMTALEDCKSMRDKWSHLPEQKKKKKKPQGRHWEYSAKKQAVQNACWKIFLYLFYKQIKYFCILCIFFSCCYLNYKANRSVMLLANKRTVSEITYSIISFSSGLKKHEEMWILTTSFHQKIQHNCS